MSVELDIDKICERATRMGRRDALKWITGGCVGLALGIVGVRLSERERRDEDCVGLEEQRKKTGGFETEEAGNNHVSVELNEGGIFACDENGNQVDIRQDTFNRAIQAIEEGGCKVQGVEGINQKVGFGSETRGLLVQVDCGE